MQALGTLPDKSSSFPNAISPEGSVVVGTSGSAAFRWTAATGMQDIGHLPDGRLTHPSGVSSNGKIVVGASYANRDHSIAFIWDAVHGMRSLQNLLQSEYGLDLSGWHLLNASAINPDGSVIVGWGTNPLGNQEAFRVIMPPPSR